jgi:hypothetical protein
MRSPHSRYKVAKIKSKTDGITEISAANLSFWMTKFIREIMNKPGSRYSPKSLYQIVCGITDIYKT